MPFSRQQVAKLDRRRALAEQIVSRHSGQEQETAWGAYIKRLKMPPKTALAYIKMQGSLPEQLAEFLEPGELDRMLANRSGVG